MELLRHVYWMKTKPSCIYLNVDPVCDRCQLAHGGLFRKSSTSLTC